MGRLREDLSPAARMIDPPEMGLRFSPTFSRPLGKNAASRPTERGVQVVQVGTR